MIFPSEITSLLEFLTSISVAVVTEGSVVEVAAAADSVVADFDDVSFEAVAAEDAK